MVQPIDLGIKLFQAALFNIPNGLKRLSYAFEDEHLHVLAVFDAPPMAFQKQCIYDLVGEVQGHYTAHLADTYRFLVETDISSQEPDLLQLIFARYDA